MKKNIVLIASLLVSGLVWDVAAQNAQNVQYPYYNVTPASPEASALAKSINYPVGYNTGVPNISIPLYDFKAGELTLPITLNYHAGGFKIRERSGVVGLGWSLSTDLQITREIRGGDDFFNANSLQGYGGYCNPKNPFCWTTYHRYDCYHWFPEDKIMSESRALCDIYSGAYDTESDRYYFKLLNKTGEFYMYKQGNSIQAIPFPYNGIKITFSEDGRKFTIIDTDGTEYIFGDTDYQKKFFDYGYSSYNPSPNFPSQYITSWKCASITSPSKKDVLTFSYKELATLSTQATRERVEVYEKSDQGKKPQNWDSATEWEGLLYGSAMLPSDLPHPRFHSISEGLDGYVCFPSIWKVRDEMRYSLRPLSEKEINPILYTSRVGLEKITYLNNSISFNYIDLSRLNQINVRNGTDNIRTINLEYSRAFSPWIMNPTPNDVTAYLDSVILLGNPGEVYKFDYEDRIPFPQTQKGSDPWGGRNWWTRDREGSIAIPGIEYTDSYTNETFIIGNPVLYEKVYGYGNLVNDQEALRGVLRRIIYPTGGFTVFDFSSNVHEQYKDWMALAGGIRIKGIRYYDKGKDATKDKPLYSKYYQYGERDAGLIKAVPSVNNMIDYGEWFRYTQNIEYFKTITLPSPDDWALGEYLYSEKKTTILPNAFSDLQYSSGSPIYYKNVSEYVRDSVGNDISRTDYIYNDPTVYGYELNGLEPGTNLPKRQTPWQLGKLEKEIAYKKEGNIFVPVAEKEYKYHAERREDGNGNWMKILGIQLFRQTLTTAVTNYLSHNVSSFEVTDYKRLEKMNREYDFMRIYNNIFLGDVLLDEMIETEYFGGQEIKTTTKYSYNDVYQVNKIEKTYPDGRTESTETKNASDFLTNGGVLAEMYNKNMLDQVVETERYNGLTLISATKTDYLKYHDSFIAPSIIYQKTSTNQYEPRVKYDFYPFAKVREIIKDDTEKIVYLWGYSNQYPVAEIRGLTYSKVRDALGEVFIDRLANSNVPAQADIDYLKSLQLSPSVNLIGGLMTIFLHKPLLGVISIINPQGKVTSYDYDSFGRLSKTRDDQGYPVESYYYMYIR